MHFNKIYTYTSWISHKAASGLSCLITGWGQTSIQRWGSPKPPVLDSHHRFSHWSIGEVWSTVPIAPLHTISKFGRPSTGFCSTIFSSLAPELSPPFCYFMLSILHLGAWHIHKTVSKTSRKATKYTASEEMNSRMKLLHQLTAAS